MQSVYIRLIPSQSITFETIPEVIIGPVKVSGENTPNPHPFIFISVDTLFTIEAGLAIDSNKDKSDITFKRHMSRDLVEIFSI